MWELPKCDLWTLAEWDPDEMDGDYGRKTFVQGWSKMLRRPLFAGWVESSRRWESAEQWGPACEHAGPHTRFSG